MIWNQAKFEKLKVVHRGKPSGLFSILNAGHAFHMEAFDDAVPSITLINKPSFLYCQNDEETKHLAKLCSLSLNKFNCALDTNRQQTK